MAQNRPWEKYAQGGGQGQLVPVAQQQIDPGEAARLDMERERLRLAQEAAARDAAKDAREAEQPGEPDFDRSGALRKEYSSLDPVKNYQTIVPLYASAIRAAPGGAGDMNIIYALAKVMDPGSVVREGELEIASSTGSFGETLKGYFQKAKTGGSLTEEIRRGLLAELRNRASAAADQHNQIRSRYSALAEQYGLDPNLILGEHPGAPFQQDEANFLGRPVRNLDGSQGAAPTEQLSHEVANQRAQNMVSQGRDFDTIAAFLRDQNLQFDEEKLREAVSLGRGRVIQGESTGLGIIEGALKPFDRAAEGLQSGVNAIFGTDFNEATEVNNQRAAFFEANPTTEGGRILGNVIGGAALTAPFGGPVTQGALANMALSDSRSAGDLVTDAVIGGVGGKLADKAIRGVAGVISPKLDPAVRRLADEGVEMTPSQIMGGRAKSMEDRATSVPVAGDRVIEGRERALETFNRAGWDRVLRPLGIRLPKNVKVGNDAVAFATEQFRKRYTDTLSKVNAELDRTFASRMFAVRQRAKLPPEQLAKFDEIFQREVANAFTPGKGKMTGRDFKMLDERLGKIATDFRAAQGDPYTRQLGEAIQGMKDQIASLVRRQNPGHAAQLRKLDEGYAQFARLRAAASKSPNDGVFSPNELMGAVRQGDRSVGKGATARGDALMQDLAADGQNVLPSSIGTSGTTERANLTDPIAWLYGLGLAPLFGKEASATFRKAALHPRPAPAKAVGNALRRAPAGATGAAAVNALLSPPD